MHFKFKPFNKILIFLFKCDRNLLILLFYLWIYYPYKLFLVYQMNESKKEDVSEKLIEEVRKRPYLWDKSRDD